jgi:hypothetical protein
MKMANKRGSSHLEIIISFVLFVGFALFLMTYLQPTQQNTLESSILLGLKNKFFDSTVSNVTIAFVQKNVTGSCFAAPACEPTEVNGKAINISVDDGVGCFYYVYASSEFSNTLMKCKDLVPVQNYTLGYIEVQVVYSNKTLQDIKNSYYNDYSGLKTHLGVPETVDFAITSESYMMNYSLIKQIPQETEVVAGAYRKPVLYANGTVVNQDFVIKIW